MKTFSALFLIVLLAAGSSARRLKQVSVSDQDSGTGESRSSAQITIGGAQSSQSTTTTTTTTSSSTSDEDGDEVPGSSFSIGGSATAGTGTSQRTSLETSNVVVSSGDATTETPAASGDSDATDEEDDAATDEEDDAATDEEEDAATDEEEKESSEPANDEDTETVADKATSSDDLDIDVQESESVPAEEGVVSTTLETKGASSVAVAGPTSQAVSVNGEQAPRICLVGLSNKLESYLEKGYEVTIVTSTNLGYRVTKMVRSGFNTSQSSILAPKLPADVASLCKDALAKAKTADEKAEVAKAKEEEKEEEKPTEEKKEPAKPIPNLALKGVCETEVTLYFPHLLSLCERYNLPTVFDGTG